MLWERMSYGVPTTPSHLEQYTGSHVPKAPPSQRLLLLGRLGIENLHLHVEFGRASELVPFLQVFIRITPFPVC